MRRAPRQRRRHGYAQVCGRLACAGDFEQLGPASVRCTLHGVTFEHVDPAAFVVDQHGTHTDPAPTPGALGRKHP